MGLAAIAARLAASAALAQPASAPIGAMDYGRIHYTVRASNASTGLGGLPPFCGPLGMDMIQIVYTVTNTGDVALPAEATPRVVIIDPAGGVHAPDRRLSDVAAQKVVPPMTLHNGELAAHSSAMQADIFLINRFATRNRGYRLRPFPQASRAIDLPFPQPVDTPECPQPSAAPAIEDR